jgi:hypothetical protein
MRSFILLFNATILNKILSAQGQTTSDGEQYLHQDLQSHWYKSLRKCVGRGQTEQQDFSLITRSAVTLLQQYISVYWNALKLFSLELLQYRITLHQAVCIAHSIPAVLVINSIMHG